MPNKDLYQISLKAFLKNAQGEVLILGADVGGTFNGFFDLPGGRINDDEFATPMTEILRREIVEEIGVSNVELQPFPIALGRHLLPGIFEKADHDFHVLYVFFEGTIDAEQITISNEHTSVKWVKLETIDIEKHFISGIREGVEMYIQRKKNEPKN